MQPLVEKLEMFEVDYLPLREILQACVRLLNSCLKFLAIRLLYKALYKLSVLLTNSEFGGTRLQTALTFRLMAA